MTDLDLTCDATALAEQVRSRQIKAREVVEATLQRIAEVDPVVHAFRVVTAADARAAARRIDSLSDADLQALPLAGVPVAIKDDTDVAGQSTMWGSSVDRGVATQDAEVVQRLRQAGAVIVGKTNVPELTLWPWTASESWGVTRNPWNLEHTPGGSSGGSAAAVCAGMAAMGLGSDGGGSVRYPAALTGLVGLKPQRHRVPVGSEHGSAWHGLLVLGPLTRSVRDAALFLDATAAPDEATILRDAMAQPPTQLRIAVATNPPPGTQVALSPAGRRTIEEATALLSSLGHEIIETDVDYGYASLWNATVRFLKGAQDDVASLPDRSRLEARTRAVARLARLLPARSLRRAMQHEASIAASITRTFDIADVIMTPLCASPAPLVDQCPSRGALRSLRASNTSAWLIPWNAIGQPALAVPIGLDEDELPTSIHLAGRTGDEATLLRLAAQIEAALPGRTWPTPPRA